jgi:hypothetical protein
MPTLKTSLAPLVSVMIGLMMPHFPCRGEFIVTQVADIRPGVKSSSPRIVTEFNGELFFTAFGVNAAKLFKTDGTYGY